MTRRLILVLLCLVLFGTSMVSAQTSTGGQICIRAYEDRNGNEQDDSGEPRITRGLSATLANVDGVIINSAQMEESLNASSGTLCFQRLAAGQYTVRIASADYSFNPPTEFITAITETGIQTFEVGGQLIVSPLPVVDSGGDLQLSTAEQQGLFTRVTFAAIGAGVVLGAMALVGALIYLLVMRRPTAQVKYATGSYPAVQTPPSTGRMEPILSPMAEDSTDAPRTALSRPTQPHREPVDYEAADDTDHPVKRPTAADDDFHFTDDDPDAAYKPPQE